MSGETDEMAAILDDLRAVFGYQTDVRPQDRAHAYIDRRRVQRGFSDTALQCAATDMVMRAFAIGRAEGASSVDGAARSAATLTRVAGELLGTAGDRRGLGEDSCRGGVSHESPDV